MLARTVAFGTVVLAGASTSTNSVSAEDSTSTNGVRERSLAALRGKNVRVTWGAEENPYLFLEDDGSYTGVLVDFLEELRKEVGFTVTIVEISEESFIATDTSNRNTACAREVSKNRTDLCVGNSWVTTQRLGYAQVLPTLWQETLEVGVTLTESASIATGLMQAFKPFHGWVWLGMFTVIFSYAFFAWYAEYLTNDRDFPDKGIIASGLNSLYHHFFGFFWSDPLSRPVTAEGRILAVGFGFFILIMLSSYTATLASLLVMNNQVPTYPDLQTALDNDAKVCMWLSVADRAAKIYPQLPAVAVDMASNKDGFDKLSSGECGVILVDRIFYAKAQERFERDCNKVLVGSPILDINVAWPAARWIIPSLSYFIVELMNHGLLDDIKRLYTPRIRCPDPGSEEQERIVVADVSGVFFISIVTFAAAACAYTVKFSLRSKAVKRRCPWLALGRGSGRMSKQVSRRRTSSSEVVHDSSVVDTEDPRDALVLAFRSDPQMQEMPFEKALLVMADARCKAREELKQALHRVTGQCSTPASSSRRGSALLPPVPAEESVSSWRRGWWPVEKEGMHNVIDYRSENFPGIRRKIEDSLSVTHIQTRLYASGSSDKQQDTVDGNDLCHIAT